jgi:hypothetical protein
MRKQYQFSMMTMNVSPTQLGHKNQVQPLLMVSDGFYAAWSFSRH